MENMIQNAQWFSQRDGKILYFTNHGNITYDKFCMDHHRFCSLSMNSGEASNSYDLNVELYDAQMLRFGYHMRAILPGKASIHVSFYDERDQQIAQEEKDISELIGVDFCDACAAFEIPCDSAYAKLSLHFSGNVTACTFGMPFLELY